MNQSSKISIIFISEVLIYIAVSFLMGFLPESFEIPVYINILLSQAIIALPAIYYVKRNGKNLKKITSGKRMSGWAVLCAVIFIFICEPLIMFLNYISSMVFGNAVAGISEEILRLPTWTNIIFIAMLPALSEEIVFRGVYYQGLRRYGFWKAALISGLFFGLMHMNWNQFSYGFVLGILFAFLNEATGNIRASMIVHFGINFESVMAIHSLKALAGHEELSELLAASQQSGSLGLMGGMELLYGSYLFLAAAISAALCILMIWLAAKACQRTGYMSWMLWGGEKQHLQTMQIEPLFNRWVLTAILLPAAAMTLFLLL